MRKNECRSLIFEVLVVGCGSAFSCSIYIPTVRLTGLGTISTHGFKFLTYVESKTNKFEVVKSLA